MRRNDRRWFLGQIGCSVAGAAVLPNTCFNARAAAGRKYFVDSVSGNDQLDGRSEAAAWRSLEPLHRLVLGPGDAVLLRRGSRFSGRLAPRGSGEPGAPIILDAYGTGPKPRVDAEGRFGETLLLDNQEFWEIGNLHLTNQGTAAAEFRYGVRLRAWDCGTRRHIHLRHLDVFDVNGSLVKNRGEGQGIVWENGGDQTRSRFDGLLIEGCHLLRTDRNGISGYSRHQTRTDWFPSLNVVIRHNLLEDIGGDCIKPWGCDGALVEHNTVRGGRMRCLDAAAGIWPWCCDNTMIQFNEVSGIKGYFDGQAFDTDGNCLNTTFQYNYTYDNDGGFMLMCNSGAWAEPESAGTAHTIIRYNISQNDRTRLFHFAGPTRDTRIYNNIFWTGPEIDLHVFLWTDYQGWARDVLFANNIVFCEGVARNSQATRRRKVEDPALYGTYIAEPGVGKSEGFDFQRNVMRGGFREFPRDWIWSDADPGLVSAGTGGRGFDSLSGYRLKADSVCRSAGAIIPDNGGRDFWGNPVPADRPPAIGAHQPG